MSRQPAYHAPPGTMSCDEIRWWLAELRRRGWGTKVMGRTLGMKACHTVWQLLTPKRWIYPTEQIRFSEVLKRIIAGELVCVPGRGGGGPKAKNNAVVAEHPVPLAMPNRYTVDLKTGRLTITPSRPPDWRLPTFQTLLKNAPRGSYSRF